MHCQKVSHNFLALNVTAFLALDVFACSVYLYLSQPLSIIPLPLPASSFSFSSFFLFISLSLFLCFSVILSLFDFFLSFGMHLVFCSCCCFYCSLAWSPGLISWLGLLGHLAWSPGFHLAPSLGSLAWLHGSAPGHKALYLVSNESFCVQQLRSAATLLLK